MILILELVESDFGHRLRSVLQKKGEKTLLLTSMRIVQEVFIAFNLDSQTSSFKLGYKDQVIHSEAIQGVYCGLTSFSPALFPRFSAEDAQYAALETQALWLALLTSLTCPLINPPALDTLSGSLLSPVELAAQAREVGLRTPTMVCVSHGNVAAHIYQSGIPARFSDLGKIWVNESNRSQIEMATFDQNPNHFLIQENPPGQPVGIGVIGKQWLPFGQASGDSFQPIDLEKVPHTLRKNIRSLHKHLHLNAAEYLFKRQEDVWTLIGVSHPPHFSLQAYQDEAYTALANFLSGGSKL